MLRQIALLPPSLPCLMIIREKHLDAATLLDLCVTVKSRAAGTGAKILVNERADIAAAAALDGVHLQESSCPADKLRSLKGAMLTGKSTHSPDSAMRAVDEGVDYLVFGPVFDTPSKRRFGSPQGTEKLHVVCRTVPVPVFAIGGISPENAALCRSAGAHGIAAISLFNDTSKFPELLKTLEYILVR
ncbi:MAG: thiamine phosphate synthase [Chlorobi bacterium]|nr:thiamine phosphate synthase [Chlorobiota bacterium]